jgi:hypothetical protein
MSARGDSINGKYEQVALGKLKPHPLNPRRGNLELVKESMRVNGLFGALLVQRSTSYVLAGNHRLLAAQELGFEKVPVIWVDVDDSRAQRIMLADNRTSDLASYDQEALAQLLDGLVNEDPENQHPLQGTGYDEAALAQLLSQLEPQDDWKPEDEWNEMPAFQQENKLAAFQVIMSFQNLEDKLAFAQLIGQTWTQKTKGAWWPPVERVNTTDQRWIAGEGSDDET